MKRLGQLLVFALLTLLLAVPAAAEGQVSVAVGAGEEPDYTVEVPDTAGHLVLCASYAENGQMLEARWVEADAAGPVDLETDGAARSAVVVLNDEGFAPAREKQEVYYTGWQERKQYGGVCVGHGEYSEAVRAYTQAAETAPDEAKPELYVDRGNARVFSGETAENLDAAKRDYNAALDLDAGNAEAYLGLADTCIRQGDYAGAEEVLTEALDATDQAPEIADKLTELREGGSIVDSGGKSRRSRTYDALSGELTHYVDYFYDELGRRTAWDIYQRDGAGAVGEYGLRFFRRGESEYEGNTSREIVRRFYGPDGSLQFRDTFEHNEAGQMTMQWRYDVDGKPEEHYEHQYDALGRECRVNTYLADNTLSMYSITEYEGDTDKIFRKVTYQPDGTVIDYQYYD